MFSFILRSFIGPENMLRLNHHLCLHWKSKFLIWLNANVLDLSSLNFLQGTLMSPLFLRFLLGCTTSSGRQACSAGLCTPRDSGVLGDDSSLLTSTSAVRKLDWLNCNKLIFQNIKCGFWVINNSSERGV